MTVETLRLDALGFAFLFLKKKKENSTLKGQFSNNKCLLCKTTMITAAVYQLSFSQFKLHSDSPMTSKCGSQQRLS